MYEDEHGSSLMPHDITTFLISLSLVVFAMPISLVMFMVCLDFYERWKTTRSHDQETMEENEDIELP